MYSATYLQQINAVKEEQFIGVYLPANCAVINADKWYPFVFTETVNYITNWYQVDHVKKSHRETVLRFWYEQLNALSKALRDYCTPLNQQFFFNLATFLEKNEFSPYFGDIIYYNRLFIKMLKSEKNLKNVNLKDYKIPIIGRYKHFNMFNLPGEFTEKLDRR